MLTFALDAYAWVICRLIWTVGRLVPRKPPAPLEKNHLMRDYEWIAMHHCASCKTRGRHHFIEWLPERVTTAECGGCGHTETLS